MRAHTQAFKPNWKPSRDVDRPQPWVVCRSALSLRALLYRTPSQGEQVQGDDLFAGPAELLEGASHRDAAGGRKFEKDLGDGNTPPLGDLGE